MPELPEVESLRQILAGTLIGRTVAAVQIKQPRLRQPIAPGFARAVTGRRVTALSRRAKYLLIELSGDHVMLAHLGMSGSLTHRDANFRSERFDPAHDHVSFRLDDGSFLIYNDPRRFGLLKVATADAVAELEEIRHLGPEPLSDALDAAYLERLARKRTNAVKNFLMDQRVVAGIGNIYASEILFKAGVRPTRRASRVRRAEFEKIAHFTKAVLRAAIDGRGTTFRSYLDSRGEPGAFAERLLVYGREGQACQVCTWPIRQVVLGQRASFYCSACQR